MAAFFFCFKDQIELGEGEGHEGYYWKVEVGIYLSQSIAESERYLSAIP